MLALLAMLIMLLTSPCLSDDGSGPPVCHWQAQTQGNGQGTSYVMINGRQLNL